MKKKWTRPLSLLLVVAVLIGAVTFPAKESYAAQSKTFQVDFGGSIVNGKSYRSNAKIYGQQVDLNVPGLQVGSWEVKVNNGAAKKNWGTLQNGVLTLPEIAGIKRDVMNLNDHNPGHIIYRDSAGEKWRTGVVGWRFEYKPESPGCTGMPSACPGLIPATGYNMDTGKMGSIPFALRDASGRAVTDKKDIASPTSYYLYQADMADYRKKNLEGRRCTLVDSNFEIQINT